MFSNEKLWISIGIPQEFVPKVPIDKNSIGSNNGLVPDRRQAIIWTNDASLGLNEF